MFTFSLTSYTLQSKKQKNFQRKGGLIAMNDKTKQLIMKIREFLKGYHFGDAGTEKTDQ